MGTLLNLGSDGLKLAYTALSDFALYLTIALAVILVVAFIVVKYKATEKLSKFKTLAFGITIGYAVTLILCISLFMVARLVIKDEIDTSFYLLLGFLGLCLIYAIALLITSLVNKKALKITFYVGLALAVTYAVIMFCFMPTKGDDYKPLDEVGMYIFSILLVIAIAVPCFLLDKKGADYSPTKAISYAGVCIALSFALSYIKLFSLPQGGSVTLASMLPLIIYSYIFGSKKGLLAGVIYGVLQCLQNPQIYQPMQVLLDYPIAFGTIGLAGIVHRIKVEKPLVKFIIGASLTLVFRYLAHFLSGYYVFSSWAMDGYSALGWGFVYNLYVIVELAIILFVGVFLFSSKAFVKQLDKLYN